MNCHAQSFQTEKFFKWKDLARCGLKQWCRIQKFVLSSFKEQMRKIIFVPTWRCQKACGYCDYLTTKEGAGYLLAAFGVKWRIIRELTWSEWAEHLERFSPFILDITGGEPTMYEGLPLLLRNLPKESCWAMTSNTILKKKIEEIDFSNCVGWTASYHFDHEKLFLECLSLIRDKGINPTVTVVFTPENANEALLKLSGFVKKGFKVNVHPLLKQGFSWANHRDTFKKMQEARKFRGVNFINEISNSWDPERHPLCRAGGEYFMLMPDGQVLRCYSSILEGKSLSNVKDYEPTQGKNPCDIDCMFPCDRQVARKR